jgi:hypothetical protein
MVGWSGHPDKKTIKEQVESILLFGELDTLKQIAEDHYDWDEADLVAAAVASGRKDYSIGDFCHDHLRQAVKTKADLAKFLAHLNSSGVCSCGHGAKCECGKHGTDE